MSTTSHSLSSIKKMRVVPVKTFEDKYRVWSVAWYPDGRQFVSGSADGKLRIWDTQTGLQVGEAIKGHGMPLLALDVSPDGKTIASGTWDRTVRLWDSGTHELIYTCKGHNDAVRDIHFSPDSKRVVSGSEDGTLRVWDANSGKLAFEPVKCAGRVFAICYSPNGDRIASGANSIQIWDALDVTLVLTIEQRTFSLAWTHDGEQLIAGGYKEVNLWNALSGEQIRTWPARTSWFRKLSFFPTTSQLVTCDSETHESLVFDADTGEQITAYEHDGAVNYVACSPSGNLIATVCDDHKVYLWEAPQSSRSPGSSMLDLPATIGPGAAEVREVIAHLPSNSMFHLPAVSRPPPLVQPTCQKRHRYRRTFRGAIDGLFRRSGKSHQRDNCPSGLNVRNQPTRSFKRVLPHLDLPISLDHRNPFTGPFRRRNPRSNKDETSQEDETSQGNWVAEARTRPIYAFETGPLPDEVERGWLFHLASYICFGRKDPNITVSNPKVPTSTGSAARMTPSTSEMTPMHHRDPYTYPPSAVTTPNETQASPLLSAHIRALLDRLFTSLRSRLHLGVSPSPSSGTPGAVLSGPSPLPQTTTGPVVPTVVVTGPLSELANQHNEVIVVQKAFSPSPLSPTLLPSSDNLLPTSAATPTVSTHGLLPELASNTTLDSSPVHLLPEVVSTLVGSSSYCDGGPRVYDNPNCPFDAQPTKCDLQTQVFDDGSGLFDNPWADPPFHLLSPAIPKASDNVSLPSMYDMRLTSPSASTH